MGVKGSINGVDARHRGLLEAAGLWNSFVDFRDQLVNEFDRSASAAAAESLRIWFRGDEPIDPGQAYFEALRLMATISEETGSPLPDDDDDGLPSLEMCPASLAGREAPEPEVVRWVVRNIDNAAASPKDCPDPFAWTLLRMCRKSDAFMFAFIKDIWGKVLASQVRVTDDGEDKKLDGRPTIELIQRIRRIRDDSGRGVAQLGEPLIHNQEVAGSSPAPATNHFAKYTGRAR